MLCDRGHLNLQHLDGKVIGLYLLWATYRRNILATTELRLPSLRTVIDYGKVYLTAVAYGTLQIRGDLPDVTWAYIDT